MPLDAAKSQWGCHFMIFSGHLPCTQQWSATCLSGHCHSTSDCIYSICQNHYRKYRVIFPWLRQTPFKNPSTNFNTNLPPRAYDTFPQQDATNTYKYIDAAFISSHLPPYLQRVMRKRCCPVLDQMALQHTIQTRKTDMSWVTGWLKKGVLLVSILICRNLIGF